MVPLMTMRRRLRIFSLSRVSIRQYGSSSARPPIIKIHNGVFYRQHPSSASTSNPPLFKHLQFELPSFSLVPRHWAIVGPSASGKTTLLEILRGQHLCFPPLSRSYPYLSSEEIELKDHRLRDPHRAVRYVGFGGENVALPGQGIKGAYLSARYESRREMDDFSVLDYLQGKTELNPVEDDEGVQIGWDELGRVIQDLRLTDLVAMPVSNLSNGQTRRATIARAILRKPEVLLLDEPFMGLDPPTLTTLSPLLHGLAAKNAPRLVLTLRSQDPIPDWITDVLVLRGNCEVTFSGSRDEYMHLYRDGTAVFGCSRGLLSPEQEDRSSVPAEVKIEPKPEIVEETQAIENGEALVEMSGVRLSYGSKTVLGNWKQEVNGEPKDGLWWTVRRGERWGIFGPNGSGKTTILSLICSDHPQTYSLPIKLFGRSRLPEPGQRGISIFDIQARIGHSSPEIHHHMPRRLTIRQVLENAWADTFLGIPQLDDTANARVEASLRWFEPELRPDAAGQEPSNEATIWADKLLFGSLPFSIQRIALFLRAIIKKPEVVILDEAFSGMDSYVRDKCIRFLNHGQSSHTPSHSNPIDSDKHDTEKVIITGLELSQALLCISHVREEVPDCIREWLCLPDANDTKPARFGRLQGPLADDPLRWDQIWGMDSAAERY